MAVTVVDIPFFCIAQNLVGFCRLLEIFFRLPIPRIPIRVTLHGKLAVALFDLIIRGASFHAQDLVVTTF